MIRPVLTAAAVCLVTSAAITALLYVWAPQYWIDADGEASEYGEGLA